MAQILEPNYLAPPELLFLRTVLSWHCLLRQSHPSPPQAQLGSALSILLCSPRPGQIHVENYCASQTTRQTLPLWNHHSSSVSSWNFLHTSVTACHTVFTTTCWTTHPRTRICMLLALAFSNTLDKLSRLRVPRGQLFVSLSVSSKQGRVKWLLRPLLQPTEETDLWQLRHSHREACEGNLFITVLGLNSELCNLDIYPTSLNSPAKKIYNASLSFGL